MKNQATELRPDIIEQFCGGAWYTAHEPLTLTRIHRRTPMDGVRKAEGG